MVLVKVGDLDKSFLAEIIAVHSNKVREFVHYTLEIQSPLLSAHEKFKLFTRLNGTISKFLVIYIGQGISVTMYSINNLNSIRKELEALHQFCISTKGKYYTDEVIKRIVLQPYPEEIVREESTKQILKIEERKDLLIDKDLREPNKKQLQIAYEAARRRVTLIQGPPGTGKTYVAALIARIWEIQKKSEVRKSKGQTKQKQKKGEPVDILPPDLRNGVGGARSKIEMGGKILAIAYTNAGVIELYNKMENMGINVGIPKSKREYEEMEGKKMTYKDYIELARRELMTYEVICVTCIKSMSALLRGFYFPQVILDEATNCTGIFLNNIYLYGN